MVARCQRRGDGGIVGRRAQAERRKPGGSRGNVAVGAQRGQAGSVLLARQRQRHRVVARAAMQAGRHRRQLVVGRVEMVERQAKAQHPVQFLVQVDLETVDVVQAASNRVQRADDLFDHVVAVAQQLEHALVQERQLDPGRAVVVDCRLKGRDDAVDGLVERDVGQVLQRAEAVAVEIHRQRDHREELGGAQCAHAHARSAVAVKAAVDASDFAAQAGQRAAQHDRQVDLVAAARIQMRQAELERGIVERTVFLEQRGALRLQFEAGMEIDGAVFDADADRPDGERQVDRGGVVGRDAGHQRWIAEEEVALRIDAKFDVQHDGRLQLERHRLIKLDAGAQVQAERLERGQAQVERCALAEHFQVELELAQAARARCRNTVQRDQGGGCDLAAGGEHRHDLVADHVLDLGGNRTGGSVPQILELEVDERQLDAGAECIGDRLALRFGPVAQRRQTRFELFLVGHIGQRQALVRNARQFGGLLGGDVDGHALAGVERFAHQLVVGLVMGQPELVAVFVQHDCQQVELAQSGARRGRVDVPAMACGIDVECDRFAGSMGQCVAIQVRDDEGIFVHARLHRCALRGAGPVFPHLLGGCLERIELRHGQARARVGALGDAGGERVFLGQRKFAAPQRFAIAADLDDQDRRGQRIAHIGDRGEQLHSLGAVGLVFPQRHTRNAETLEVEPVACVQVETPGTERAHLVRIEREGVWNAGLGLEVSVQRQLVVDKGGRFGAHHGIGVVGRPYRRPGRHRAVVHDQQLAGRQRHADLVDVFIADAAIDNVAAVAAHQQVVAVAAGQGIGAGVSIQLVVVGVVRDNAIAVDRHAGRSALDVVVTLAAPQLVVAGHALEDVGAVAALDFIAANIIAGNLVIVAGAFDVAAFEQTIVAVAQAGTAAILIVNTREQTGHLLRQLELGQACGRHDRFEAREAFLAHAGREINRDRRCVMAVVHRQAAAEGRADAPAEGGVADQGEVVGAAPANDIFDAHAEHQVGARSRQAVFDVELDAVGEHFLEVEGAIGRHHHRHRRRQYHAGADIERAIEGELGAECLLDFGDIGRRQLPHGEIQVTVDVGKTEGIRRQDAADQQVGGGVGCRKVERGDVVDDEGRAPDLRIELVGIATGSAGQNVHARRDRERTVADIDGVGAAANEVERRIDDRSQRVHAQAIEHFCRIVVGAAHQVKAAAHNDIAQIEAFHRARQARGRRVARIVGEVDRHPGHIAKHALQRGMAQRGGRRIVHFLHVHVGERERQAAAKPVGIAEGIVDFKLEVSQVGHGQAGDRAFDGGDGPQHHVAVATREGLERAPAAALAADQPAFEAGAGIEVEGILVAPAVNDRVLVQVGEHHLLVLDVRPEAHQRQLQVAHGGDGQLDLAGHAVLGKAETQFVVDVAEVQHDRAAVRRRCRRVDLEHALQVARHRVHQRNRLQHGVGGRIGAPVLVTEHKRLGAGAELDRLDMLEVAFKAVVLVR